MPDLIVGEKDARGLDWVSITLGACLGATITFAVGMQNGEQVGHSIEQATQSCVDELGVRNADSAATCWDMQADALHRIEMQRQALDRLADRCVLSVPSAERLRVTKTRDVRPIKVQTSPTDWSSPDYFRTPDPDGMPDGGAP
jgi:hypothetical protein